MAGCSGRCRSSASASGTSCSPSRWASDTDKLPFGHRGGNHPVRRIGDGGVEITSQNHSYAVGPTASPTASRSRARTSTTARSRASPRPSCAPSVQYHPEAGPGPRDARYLFGEFTGALGGRLMPRRDDLETILLIGSGPIVIGQACEFDYSGTQAVPGAAGGGLPRRAGQLEPGHDHDRPRVADRTYVEPLDAEVVEAIIEQRAARRAAADPRRPDRAQPGDGARRATGVLERYGVELIGADVEAIARPRTASCSSDAMAEIGLAVPREPASSTDLARRRAPRSRELGLPVIMRPAFTLGGQGGGIAYNAEEFEQRCAERPRREPVGEILIERVVLGWKEYRARGDARRGRQRRHHLLDRELRPDGRPHRRLDHRGAGQTLTDIEYQRMRDAAIACIRAVGVETGGSNIQFALDPRRRARWSSSR